MPTYTPNPPKILDYNNRIFQQPQSIQIQALDNTTRTVTVSDFPPNGIFKTYAEIKEQPLNEPVLVYKAKNGLTELYLTNGGETTNDYVLGYIVKYNGNNLSAGSKTAPKSVIESSLDKYAGFVFFENENKLKLIHILSDFWVPTYYAATLGTNNYTISQLLNNSAVPEDPYAFTPDSEPDGGYGDFDYSGDSILPPDLPTISVADSGFVTLYAPTLGQIQSLASYMWSGLFDIATFRKLFADPMDCIISLNIVPVDLPSGSSQELKVGNIGTGQQINVLSAQFIKISFATKNIGVRTNSFMDYSPYVKAQIFLPFIGTRSLSIDDIANADVTVEYHVDLFSGACTAYIVCKKNNSDGSELKSALYEFSGNISANIPFTATNYNSFLSSLLGTAAAVTTAIATQGSSSAVAGALSSGIDTATAIKPDVERSGNMSATNGFLGIQTPFLIITYPHVCKPACRDKTVGTPSFIGLSSSKKLSSFHKLTKLHRINAKGIPCTEQERRLIIDQLTGEGVILP